MIGETVATIQTKKTYKKQMIVKLKPNGTHLEVYAGGHEKNH